MQAPQDQCRPTPVPTPCRVPPSRAPSRSATHVRSERGSSGLEISSTSHPMVRGERAVLKAEPEAAVEGPAEAEGTAVLARHRLPRRHPIRPRLPRRLPRRTPHLLPRRRQIPHRVRIPNLRRRPTRTHGPPLSEHQTKTHLTVPLERRESSEGVELQRHRTAVTVEADGSKPPSSRDPATRKSTKHEGEALHGAGGTQPSEVPDAFHSATSPPHDAGSAPS
jgi:hypothetical protein